MLRVRDEIRARLSAIVGLPISDLSPLLGPNGRVHSELVYDLIRRRDPLVDWGPLIWGRRQCRR